MARKLHDRYFKQAKREGHLARSYYKLEELNRRHRLFRRGDRVLDLGACPGSWLEYILAVIGEAGIACAVDLKLINKRFKGRVHFRKLDIRELEADVFAAVAGVFDAVVSDLAPATSGVKTVDQARSLELAEAAADHAFRVLRRGGNFVCKILEGPDLGEFRGRLQKRFRELKTRKPDASRDCSAETYLVGLGFGLPQKKPGGSRRPTGSGRKKKKRKR